MPRRQRHRTMKGGFWDSLTQGVSDAWEKTKKASSDAYNSATGSTTGTSSYTPQYSAQPMTPPPASTSSGYLGGKKRSRKMRGGYSDNMALTGLAASAAPISDIKSSQPLNIVGGKRTKKRRHRHNKSCKSRRH